MSYEKLGFVKGQKLKADHLNHMEDGIANAGGAGIEYYTGAIEISESDPHTLHLLDLNFFEAFDKYYEMEIGIVLNQSSTGNPCAKYTFLLSNRAGGYNAVENQHYSNGPTANLVYDNGAAAIRLTPASGSYSTSIYNPSVVYIRLYQRA